MTEELLQQAINRVLEKALTLDPELPEKLAAFNGKVIAVHFKYLEKTFYLMVEDESLRVSGFFDGDADVTISGTPIAIMKMIVQPNVATLLLKGEIEISGDTRLGNNFKKLFREMELNWQQPVAGIIGDGATWQLESGLGRLNNWARKSVASFGLGFSEYFQEESRDIVTETELEIFNHQVDRLRDDTERLQARLSAMTKH